ncbi:MAG: DMT family transporter [Myxococcales bacterium]|nr:DMT family transporter [Myxococcales bacterium]
MQSRRGTWLIVLSSVFFAVMAVLARHLSKSVPAFQLSFTRFGIGAVLMASHFLVRRRPPDLSHAPKLLLRGLFGTGAVLTYFIAIERLGSGPATVLNYCSPIYAALFAGFFLGERPSGLARIGLGLATIGAVLVSVATGEFSTPLHPGIGGIAGLASGIFGGAAITVIRSLRKDTNAPTVFAAFSFVGLVVTTPLALPGWVPLEGALLPLVLAMGLLSVGGQLLFTLGMGFTSATAGSATTQLVPVLAWVLGIWVLAEPVSLLSAAGALLCVSGVVLGALRQPGGAAFRQSPDNPAVTTRNIPGTSE